MGNPLEEIVILAQSYADARARVEQQSQAPPLDFKNATTTQTTTVDPEDAYLTIMVMESLVIQARRGAVLDASISAVVSGAIMIAIVTTLTALHIGRKLGAAAAAAAVAQHGAAAAAAAGRAGGAVQLQQQPPPKKSRRHFLVASLLISDSFVAMRFLGISAITFSAEIVPDGWTNIGIVCAEMFCESCFYTGNVAEMLTLCCLALYHVSYVVPPTWLTNTTSRVRSFISNQRSATFVIWPLSLAIGFADFLLPWVPDLNTKVGNDTSSDCPPDYCSIITCRQSITQPAWWIASVLSFIVMAVCYVAIFVRLYKTSPITRNQSAATNVKLVVFYSELQNFIIQDLASATRPSGSSVALAGQRHFSLLSSVSNPCVNFLSRLIRKRGLVTTMLVLVAFLCCCLPYGMTEVFLFLFRHPGESSRDIMTLLFLLYVFKWLVLASGLADVAIYAARLPEVSDGLRSLEEVFIQSFRKSGRFCLDVVRCQYCPCYCCCNSDDDADDEDDDFVDLALGVSQEPRVSRQLQQQQPPSRRRSSAQTGFMNNNILDPVRQQHFLRRPVRAAAAVTARPLTIGDQRQGAARRRSRFDDRAGPTLDAMPSLQLIQQRDLLRYRMSITTGTFNAQPVLPPANF